MFEIKHRDAAGRICEWKIGKNVVNTPTLIPVINPNRMVVSPRELKTKFKAEIIITNAYIIKKSERSKEIQDKGLHKFLGWNGPIYTDSGTFQMYSQKKVEISPLQTIKFQQKINSDIITPLDEFTLPEDSLNTSEKKLNTTLERIKEARKLVKGRLLVGPVQGGSFLQLREQAARGVSNLNVDVFAIGGIVPLMEQYKFRELVDVILHAKGNLVLNKPVHAFGAGHPILFSLLVALGIDLFDSAAYAIFAAKKKYMTLQGTRDLNELKALPCSCPVCTSHEPKGLTEKLLAEHNLYITFNEINTIKQAIYEGRLFELVEQRIRAHPTLIEAYRQIKTYLPYLERFEPISKDKAFFYTGEESYLRPSVFRFKKRILERYYPPANRTNYIVNGYTEKISSTKNSHFCVIKEPFGIIPVELLNVYPLRQSVVLPAEDIFAKAQIRKDVDAYLGKHQHHYNKIHLVSTIKSLKFEEISKQPSDHTLEIRSTLLYQFGKNADKILDRNLQVEISRSTGRIRRIYREQRLLGMIRASDGLFVPSIHGAKLLMKHLPYPAYRVVINKDAIPFVREGKSVFCKFVLDADDEIRPHDEVLIVDENDNLIAIGKALLNKEEMLQFQAGVAVMTRHVAKKHEENHE